MSVTVIVLDARILADSGLLAPNTFKTGKLRWDVNSETGLRTLTMRYAVDTSQPNSMTMKVDYFVQLPGAKNEEVSYKIPLRRGRVAGDDVWGFVCPSTKKTVSRLILHPGDRYFIGDLRSMLAFE